MGILGRARVVVWQRLLQRPIRLGYPLHGLRGTFPATFRRRPPEIHYVNQMVERLRRHHVCLDVGAYIGYYTLLFARYGAQAVAFEPLPANLRVLRHNVTLNRLDNASIVDAAVGAEQGTVSLAAGPGIDSMASTRRAEGRRHQVRQVDLDSFCSEHGLEPDVVKIDVEGAELEVLRGMQHVLAARRPLLFLEVHTACVAEADVDAAFVALRGLSYRIYSWREDVEPGGFGFWRDRFEVEAAGELKVGATMAVPS